MYAHIVNPRNATDVTSNYAKGSGSSNTTEPAREKRRGTSAIDDLTNTQEKEKIYGQILPNLLITRQIQQIKKHKNSSESPAEPAQQRRVWERILQAPQRPHTGRPLEQFPTLAASQWRQLLNSAEAMIVDGCWAESTRTNRQYLHQNFRRFLGANNETIPSEENVLVYLAYKRQQNAVLPQSMREYLTSILTMGEKLNWGLPKNGILEDFRRSLTDDISGQVDRKMEESDLTLFLTNRRVPIGTKLVAFLAAKTASRIDEVCRLTLDNVRKNGTELYIWFEEKTKSSRRRPYRVDMTTIVTTNTEIPSDILNTFIGTTETSAVLQALRKVFPDHTPPYGLHSFKKGAYSSCLRILNEQKTTQAAIKILMKHFPKQLADTLDDGKSRYGTKMDRIAAVRAYGIHNLTREILVREFWQA